VRLRRVVTKEVFDTFVFVGCPRRRNSSFRYHCMMGLKEEAVGRFGFEKLDVFRPGIVGTPLWAKWVGYLAPGSWGTIEQEDIGRSIANRLKEDVLGPGLNPEMRQQSLMF
jgi:hypothetical protein